VGDNQMADAKTLASAKIDIHAVAEHGMDDPPAITDRNQTRSPGRRLAATPCEQQPFLKSDAGIMQPYQGIGCAGARRIDRKRLKLFIHG